MQTLPRTTDESCENIYGMIMNIRKPVMADQLTAVLALPKIAAALGPKRTANELFPYIIETPSFNEKIWLEIINQLPNLQLNKYSNDDLKSILSDVSQISKIESHQIRNSIISAFYIIFQTLDQTQISNILIPQILSMLKSPLATIRSSAIYIYSKICTKLSEANKSTIFREIQGLESDKTPLVRQSLSYSAAIITKTINKVEQDKLLEIMTKFSRDECLSVALPVADYFVSFVATTGRVSEALQVGEDLMIHPNWKVRARFMSQIHDIFSKDTSAEDIFNFISPGLNDSDPEVAAAAAKQVAFYLTISGANIAQAQAALEAAFNDQRPQVVSAGLRSLPTYLSKKNDVDFATKNLTKLAKSDNPDISLAALEVLKCSTIPDDVSTSCITELLKSKEWREREPVVRMLPQLINHPSDSALSVIKLALFDDACAVRSAALDSTVKIASNLGKEWCLKDFIKIFQEGAKSDDYQLRQTAAIAVIDIGIQDSSEVYETMKSLCADPVTNVRYVIAKRLPRNSKLLDLFKNETDQDVKDACT
ncbi:hypothetical protein TVAG_188260 [Trichomonas vaginalis G3]|uniref:HEAT repeat family protein n=1 Tax=Trichomonas vaginalis (strain ATCC PRA-98 / G3) TaxID=412133 RepID=A2DV48_TRIV3|nr:meiotic spindle elongation [Trichomonas vaginalis G3]EAY15775.1 hypothetical protein TVAG_188260 [Trichomonas vaginalis G3]KAI5486546.1 meiotic spindle elongation [Trichomonas vaginalis G3]|eukprot:XP_001327998.1 hypothetical protein [Trichomonas vaginalis G3]